MIAMDLKFNFYLSQNLIKNSIPVIAGQRRSKISLNESINQRFFIQFFWEFLAFWYLFGIMISFKIKNDDKNMIKAKLNEIILFIELLKLSIIFPILLFFSSFLVRNNHKVLGFTINFGILFFLEIFRN